MKRYKTITVTTLILFTTLPLFPLHAQAPPVKPERDGPASAELRIMLQGDQTDRAYYLKQQALPAKEAARAASADDKRLARARVLVQQNKLVTAEDFEIAALLFQHGRMPDDYLVAHELSVISLLKTRQKRADTMPVLAEDRFLETIGCKQRFGSQSKTATNSRTGKISIKLSDVDEDDDLSATDALRADLFMPPLSFSRKQQLTPTPEILQSIIPRLKQRYNAKWQAEQARRPEAQELERLAKAEPTDVSATRVLALYRADNLLTPADYANAATVLLNTADTPTMATEKATTSRCLLLAHELAMVATLRKHPAGPRLFAQTWDRFLVASGQRQRYGTYTKQRGSRAVYVGGFSGSTNKTVQVMFAQRTVPIF